MNYNKAIIVGRLTRDPENRALPSGAAVTTFSMATNRVWKDKDGAQQESTDFHNIVVFGRQAETSGQYLKKGQMALVEGRMQTRSWESEGVKKYRTEVVADRVQFGPKAGAGGGASVPADPKDGGTKEEGIEYPSEDINPDDIPF